MIIGDEAKPLDNVIDQISDRCCLYCKEHIIESRKHVRGPLESIYEEYAKTNCYHPNAELFQRERNVARNNLLRIEATLALLEAERSRLKGVLAKYSVILHPIRQLPSEIMQKIFLFCVDRHIANTERVFPDEPDRGSFPFPTSTLNPFQMPWLLGQICASWRTVALSTPDLWASVAVDVRRSVGDLKKQVLSSNVLRLGLQLSRSQNHPLSISLLLKNEQPFHPWILILCSRSSNWRYLRLDGEVNGLRSINQVQHFLPSLEILELKLNAVSPIDLQVDLFEQAPRLETLILTGIPMRMAKLPLHQLKRFRWNEDGHWQSVNAMVTFVQTLLWPVLRALSKVEICSLNFASVHSLAGVHSHWSNLSALQYDCLQSLEITSHSSITQAGVQYLLRRLTAPSLIHLKIWSRLSGVSELIEFVQRSLCKLTTLVIYGVDSVPAEQFAKLLSLMPDLTRLEFGFLGHLLDAHIQILADTQAVVPSLEDLGLLSHPGLRSLYSDEVVLQVLESRRGEGQPEVGKLRSIQLDRSIIEPSSKRRLDILRARGLIVAENAL
ncbi:hypothetical protein VNI00_006785 [Paramarasmius palmivorus]|uniref:F-box domain-containing protein n=1 Tax=Paramarasmius palmivorus TaxID=297713 RepID=A0AAW0D7X3_9AGAR